MNEIKDFEKALKVGLGGRLSGESQSSSGAQETRSAMVH